MGRLRISAISYLNTAPLMWDFEHGDVGSKFEISYTIPSLCAEALRTGNADIGIIPAAAYTSIPNLLILPDVAIAAERAVRSILLVSKVPLEQIASAALDASSMTSVALVKVILSMLSRANCTYDSMPPDLDSMLMEHDAALLIGDPALQVDRSRYLTYDLAEEWIRLTAKPFVFAFWAVREAALKQWNSELDLAQIFQQSRDHGLEPNNLAELGREWSRRLRMSEVEVRRYLTENIHYYFDSPCMDGLTLFYEKAAHIGALPTAPALNFVHAARTTTK
jgi:chorismate dehydratase